LVDVVTYNIYVIILEIWEDCDWRWKSFCSGWV